MKIIVFIFDFSVILFPFFLKKIIKNYQSIFANEWALFRDSQNFFRLHFFVQTRGWCLAISQRAITLLNILQTEIINISRFFIWQVTWENRLYLRIELKLQIADHPGTCCCYAVILLMNFLVNLFYKLFLCRNMSRRSIERIESQTSSESFAASPELKKGSTVRNLLSFSSTTTFRTKRNHTGMFTHSVINFFLF